MPVVSGVVFAAFVSVGLQCPGDLETYSSVLDGGRMTA